jgi:hypothetical protein
MPALRPLPTPPLNIDRIKALHEDIEAYIDRRVAEEAKACPGVPAVRIKHDLMGRAGGCVCRAYFLNPEKAS